MIIDVHHHLSTEPDYAGKLVAECKRLKIAKVCLFGAGKGSFKTGTAGNDEVRKAMEEYPDTIVGFAYFDLGEDPPNKIDDFVAQGFKGVKFINPTRNYDDKDFFEVYARLEANGLPALFHLGIVARRAHDKAYDINNNRHRPVYLDTIARAFGQLNIIGAHFGNPWYEEAAMACRWNPNLYFDLSGSTLKCKPSAFLGQLLWWTPKTRYRDPQGRHAWEKIVFGSDVPCDEIEDVLNDYKKVMTKLKLPQKIQKEVLGGTAAGILGLQGEQAAT
ncbi:MAG: amidohydrolase family protein [Phycisphaerae bacterium]|jgi:hypothetical protein|nr:amidohydrolase family protein [Phycisphaerae bacterium]MDP7636183.1 amidohydrolase family protein [Phycisphaerae bacterium]